MNCRIVVLVCLLACLPVGAAGAAEPLAFQVETVPLLQELHPAYCWFHPRAAAIPGHGREGMPAVVVTLQKHLVADDHYSGLWAMRSNDLGLTWSAPREVPELAWRPEPGSQNVTLAVADVTPAWHARSGRLIAIGIQVRYDQRGAALLDKPRSYDLAYTVYNPGEDRWTVWRNLRDVPEPEGRFHTLAPGCAQFVVKDDGTLLVPVYIKGPSGGDYQVTVLHLGFDGQTLNFLSHGDVLGISGGRGYSEPSLALFQQRYYLTLRHDTDAFVTTSDDGLRYGPILPWRFDDGQSLGSYNTQAHWLVHGDGLFLCYTRRGANNDHIARHRAPLFMARVDHRELRVVRSTEQVLMPERGTMLGNFGAAGITADEAWVTDSEFMHGGRKHPRGADGTTWLARVKWATPNQLLAPAGPPLHVALLGDSITKAQRQGVGPTETFGWMLGAALRARGINAQIYNLGIGGETTAQALARLERDVIALRPHIVTVMYGTNDSYVDQGERLPRVSQGEYHQNLGKILAGLRAAGTKPVLMTPPRWARGAKNGRGDDPNLLLEEYLSHCREVARDAEVPLVDHFTLWSKAQAEGADLSGWTTDLCHPNPAGQRKLADAILPVLLRMARPGP